MIVDLLLLLPTGWWCEAAAAAANTVRALDCAVHRFCVTVFCMQPYNRGVKVAAVAQTATLVSFCPLQLIGPNANAALKF